MHLTLPFREVQSDEKAIITLTAIFAVQIILLCCLGAPAKELVKWSQNEYGDYSDYVLTSCSFGDRSLLEINNAIDNYTASQKEKYTESTDGYEMIRVTATRVIKDTADTAIIEYNTERYIYESEESGKIIGYSLLETARLTIDGTGSEIKLSFSPVEKTDCAAHEFLLAK